MSPPLLLRRPKLIYPGGLPGYDPNHVVAAGTVLSAIPVNGNYINLLTGKGGIVTNLGAGTATPTPFIDSSVGPSESYGATAGTTEFSGAPATVSGLTQACFYRTPASVLAFQTFFSFGSVANSGVGFLLWNTGVPALSTGTGALAATVLANNTPYFIAASTLIAASTPAIFVIVNLNTGAVVTSSVTWSPSITSGDGNFIIGQNGFGQNASGRLGPVMMSNQYNSLPKLLKWASDPWLFWYPSSQGMRTLENVSGGTIAPSIIPYNPWPLWAPILSQ